MCVRLLILYRFRARCFTCICTKKLFLLVRENNFIFKNIHAVDRTKRITQNDLLLIYVYIAKDNLFQFVFSSIFCW